MPPTDPSTALELHVPGATGTLALAPQAWGLAQRIAGTDFVPSAFRGKPEAVLAAILTGNELGIGPMQSLAKIHVINGKPGLAAELMRAIVLADGHDFWIEESTSTRCVVGGQRKNSERQTKVAWTLDDAKRANLVGKDVWKAYPTAMLLSRATSALCRAIFPDVLAGLTYTPEELEDLTDDAVAAPAEPGSPADLEAHPPPPPATAQARRPATRGTTPPADVDAPVAEKVEREAPPLPGEEDEITDAEIVEPGTPPADPPYEGPDEHIEREGPGPSYSGPQIIAMKATELGLDREEKLVLCSHLAGRRLESTNDLTPEETSLVLETLGDEGAFEAAWLAAVSVDPNIEPDPAPAEEPRRRRSASPGPEAWDADAWRKFLRERGVKVTEFLAEANRLAREGEIAPPTTLDGIGPTGLAATLVGFVEDLAASRKT